MAEKNPLGMSDEEFLKSGAFSTKPEPTIEITPEEAPEAPQEPETPEIVSEEPDDTDATPEAPVAPEAGTGKPATDEPAPDQDAGKDAVPETQPETGKDAPHKDKKEPVSEENAPKVETPDYQKFYNQVMQPIKANGKTIELKTPEEAIRLMQMGAGFTKKLQDLQPVMKTVRMLEKADLLSEDKLSYLIDIHNKNPEAIRKLIKESGIDPLDLNQDDNVSYTPGNHSVSDAEMAFNDALNDVQSREGGSETIQTINQTWDQKSVQLAWENPDILGVIQSQREQGIYPIIAAEIDRQKLLGHIPPTTPFLHAYRQIGDLLASQGRFNHLDPQASQETPQQPSSPGQETPKAQPQVIATRTGQPKAQVANGDKAQAAAPTSATPKRATTAVNPLAMADDEFLKQFNGRL